MAEKKITIAFARGGILPGKVMGTETDVSVSPGEPVRVPETYGRHLIDDRFASEVEAKVAAKSADGDGKGKKSADDAAAKAKTEAAKAVADAEAALMAAGDDMVAKAAAEDALKAARDALAALSA